MGKNPIMEKSDAGAACLSWTFFFHNSVGDHNSDTVNIQEEIMMPGGNACDIIEWVVLNMYFKS